MTLRGVTSQFLFMHQRPSSGRQECRSLLPCFEQHRPHDQGNDHNDNDFTNHGLGIRVFSSSTQSRSADKAGIGSIGLGPETGECLAYLVVGASIDLDADNVSDRHHPFDKCLDICEVGSHRV